VLEALLCGAVLGQQPFVVFLGHLLFQPLQEHFLLAQASIDRQHLVVDGVVAAGKGVDRLLAQVADAGAARRSDAARGGRQQASQHPQQGGLPDPVGAHQPDLAVVGDRRRDPQKEVQVAERHPQIGHCQQRHSAPSFD
jgi:hypothetical protein